MNYTHVVHQLLIFSDIYDAHIIFTLSKHLIIVAAVI